MDVYVLIKSFALSGKEYPKGKLATSADIGEENIKRLLKNGYIKSTSASTKTLPGMTFYLVDDDYLPPEQIDKLNKSQLIEYARKIGLAGFKSNISAADLKALIKQFIEDAEDSDDDTDEGNEE